VPGDTKLETPEGALTMTALARTPAALLSRTDDRTVRFAMIKAVRKLAGAQPVLRLTLSNGSAVRVAPNQVLLGRGMIEVRAGELRPGDELEAVFAFPDGYAYTADGGEACTSRASVTVTAVEAAGEADLYAFAVNRTGRFAFAAGVFGRAEGS
jgi:hypothetical protein